MLIFEADKLLLSYAKKGWKNSIVILDGSWYLPNLNRDPYKEYLKERIPNSIFFDIDLVSDTNSDLPHTVPNKKQFENSMNKLGINNDDHVVIYSKDGIGTSPRVWWLFKIFGHKKISILNGGLKAWKKMNGKVEKGPHKLKTTSHYTATYNSGYCCDIDEVKKSINRSKIQIIDARSEGRFKGIEPEPRKNLKSGHIPYSFNLPYQVLLDAEGKLLNKKHLKHILAKYRINLDSHIISTCGSGVSACVLALALEIIGKNNWKVYDGSWTEWETRRRTNT